MGSLQWTLARLLGVAGLSISLGYAGPASAASFDCKKASTAVEKGICSDTKASGLDEQLADTYRQLLRNSPDSGLEATRNEQRAWLKVRDACAQPAAQLASCLQRTLGAREDDLVSKRVTAEHGLDQIIAGIPHDPKAAAASLMTYSGPLASAWLVYLHQFEKAAGVSDAVAEARRKSAVASLHDDDFAASIYQDAFKDKDAAYASLLLLRMSVEREGYSPDPQPRPYVHCFVFSRQGAAAYRAFGALYGSSRDSMAPICPPQGDLFEQPAWKALGAALEPILDQANQNSGSIRYSSFASWAVLDLNATVDPRSFIAPDPLVDGSLEPKIRAWKDAKQWPLAQRQQLFDSLAPARQTTSQWLIAQRGLNPQDAQTAAEHIVQRWLGERFEFIQDNLGEEAGQ